MDNNEIDSGCRVTRSLRKRLASVDCDNSGRPETPSSSKYTSIAEITASPSRLTRMTRRNSTSGNATPVKRGVGSSAIMSNLKTITPTKTRTRKRSASVNENEDFSQKSLKTLTALDEEISHSDLKSTRFTRSQSKSPLLSNSCNTSSAVATPMKTPANRGVGTSAITDNLKKRYTQRHSISPNENEELSQECLKTPTALDRETVHCHLKPTRATRSQSKSPLLNNSLHTSPGSPTLTKTPAKRGAGTSPKKTLTQKSNISKNEIEDFSPKSLKVLASLDEEISECGLKSSRVTRSQSKSPLLNNSLYTFPGSAALTKTPAKTRAGTPSTETPTQRSSMSTNEIEELSPKSLKALDGEIGESGLKSSRATRSQSKSPLVNNSLHTSPGSPTLTKTPAKRGAGTSPKKTLTQKSNISKNEIEDFSPKSLKVLASLDEEISECGLKSSRVTRSQSKSPLLNNSLHTSPGSPTLAKTPAKRGVGTSPKKTVTQKSSMSRNEIEELSPKSLKALDKETGEIGLKSGTLVRSLSKSPSISHGRNTSSTSLKKRKPGPKSKTCVNRELDEDFSDVEISIFENEMEDMENTLSNIVATVLADDDLVNIKAKESKLEVKRDDLELSEELQIEKNNHDTEQTNGDVAANIEVIKELILDHEISGEKQNINILDDNVQNKTVDVQGLSTTKNKVKFDGFTSENNNISVSISNVEVSDYNNVNQAQVRSPQIDGSSLVACNSLDISLDKVDENIMYGNDDVVDAKIPPLETLKYSQSSEEDQNSTKINMECSKEDVNDGVLYEEIKKTDKPDIAANILEKDNDYSHSQNGELKWIIPSVKRSISNDSKLDTVKTLCDKKVNNCCDNIVQICKEGQRHTKTIIFSSEDEEEDDYNELDDSYKQKHDFIDDEAMEVQDYVSGDSMDFEERKEMEENEIPLDGESIGNQTTDDDQDESAEEKNSESDDSFIVSDNEELKFHESGDDTEINDHIETNNRMKYKRIQRISDSSSTTDEEMEEHNYFTNNDNINNHKDILKSTNPQQQNDSPSENVDENVSEITTNNLFLIEDSSLLIKSRDNIILDSSKLSDSALQLHCSDGSECGEAHSSEEINVSEKETIWKLNQSDLFNKSVRNLNPENDASPAGIYKTSEVVAGKNYSENSIEKNASMRQTEDNVGEISITSESDADKENEQNSMCLATDININTKLLEPTVVSSSFAVSQENDLAKQDIRYLETSTNMSLPLGNPLIRTRRQSLALPTNPDMEICSSSHVEGIDNKINRKSLGILSKIDFKPSQSFIDSIELQKNERNRFITKRKRLSKSFAGASETHDNSIIDVDVRHLHKKSKLMDESSIEESKGFTADISSCKPFTEISSTPCEKINKNLYNSERILTRCEEIMEAANRAKLADKIRNKKSKTKISKKQFRNKFIATASDGIKPDDILRGTSKEIKRRDKIKKELLNAIKAADGILSEKKNIHRIQKEEEKLDSKEVAEDVAKAIGKSIPIKKNCAKELIHKQEKIKKAHTTSTSAGIFMELPQSPERKKSTYIQLATGKVSVEPITPKKGLVKSYNGMKFRESPVTPKAVGFKVSKIVPLKNTDSPPFTAMTGKRKRCNELFKDCTTAKAHWTESGLFTEEYVTKNRGSNLQKRRNRQEEKKEHNVNYNFKEKSIMRPEIKRSTKREILLLKERRYVRDTIKK